MNGVFLDTVGLIAVWDTSDQWHRQAADVFNALLQEKPPLLTTSYVLLECGNAASRRPYRHRVNALRGHLAMPICSWSQLRTTLKSHGPRSIAAKLARLGLSTRFRLLSCDGWKSRKLLPTTITFAPLDLRHVGSRCQIRPLHPHMLRVKPASPGRRRSAHPFSAASRCFGWAFGCLPS